MMCENIAHSPQSLVCGASAAARKIACYAPITMDKTAPKIKYAPRQKQFRSAQLAQAATHEETMQFKHVTLDLDGSVAILKLDHQEVMNAVSVDMLGGLAEALDAIEEKKDEVRCV